MENSKYGDISVEIADFVATVELHRPPHNYFDHALIRDLADAFDALDANENCRAIVLAAEGRSFCAGANFQAREPVARDAAPPRNNPLYSEAVRLFGAKKPAVAAVQGAAIGGGFGLALVADFRIVTPEARFAANFVKIGIHPGFGLTHTLPRLIGHQRAAMMMLTGRRIDGETALAWGLADQLTTPEKLRVDAHALAAEIAENAPLAVQSTRATLRRNLAQSVQSQTDLEFIEQSRLMKTADHAEGVRAVAERRPGNFRGK